MKNGIIPIIYTDKDTFFLLFFLVHFILLSKFPASTSPATIHLLLMGRKKAELQTVFYDQPAVTVDKNKLRYIFTPAPGSWWSTCPQCSKMSLSTLDELEDDLPDIFPGEIVHNDNGDISFKIINQVGGNSQGKQINKTKL